MAYLKTLISLILLVGVGAMRRDEKVNDWNVQGEMAQPEDIEGDANVDLKFDLEITSNEKRPKKNKKLPDPKEVERLYEEEKGRLMKEAEAAGDDLFQNATVAIKWEFQYYDNFDWNKHTMKYCPRSWAYQCQGTNVSMPCFYTWNGRHYEWCCPFWPKVQITRCSCCQCAVLTSSCATQGQCHRRYTKQSFIAVCYRNKQWAYLQFMVKYLPTSCYCRI